ncbi:MAG TPA: hypothetical protein DCO72_07410 [Ruminococcus sp.]|nr:hypothetical protein [Ruminococcus sp.]
MKKRFSAILLVLGMLCSFCPLTAHAEESEPIEQIYNGFTYLNHGDHIEMTGFDSPSGFEKHTFQTVEIPDEIDGLPVTSIGKMAFRWEEFSTVILPDTLTTIEAGAFACCSNLTEIEFPESLTSIGNSAFASTGLKAVSIPETVTEFGKNIFYDCADLETAELPDNMTAIPEELFQSCRSLQNFNFPEHLTTIEHGAFMGCFSLENIVIPETVTTLGNNCFSSCKNLKEVNIPDSVTEMGDGIFANCRNLKKITIPDTITEIPFDMLGFSGLENITFSENVQYVSCSLTWCENLKSVTFLNPDCEIFDNQMTIFNSAYENNYQFGGIIYGYENSTAQAYAEKYGYEFRTVGDTFISDVMGDISGDGKLSVVDVIQVRKGILSRTALPKISDLNGDNIVNVIDLSLLKKALLKQ